MNTQAIYHRPESNYCFATDVKNVKLRIRFAKGEKIQKLSVLYNTKYEYAKKRYESKLSLIASDKSFDYYGVTLLLNDRRLAYVFYFEYDGKPYYFAEDGVSEKYDFEFAYFNSFQVAYVNDSDVVRAVDWLKNAVFYQIFVDRFCRSTKTDPYVNAEWGDIPTPRSFYGGDLYGIAENIDYIKSLGVNALYLTPVFKSKSNHKYDTIDYYEVDDSFGGNSALKLLVETAHKNNIKVVLDAVFNHVSQEFAPFVDVRKNGRKSKFYDWFVIDGESVDVNKGNYDCFAECKYMPKLNADNSEVSDYLTNVAVYYVKEYGIDGWRLDVSDEVSHDFWRRMRKKVKAIKSDAVLIGENWHNSQSYLEGDQFDGIMNYAVMKCAIDFFAEGKIDANSLAERMNGLYMRYNDVVNSMMFNLLDSHDTARFLTLCNGDKNKFLTAFATLCFLPGSVNLYYGSELLMQGKSDPDCRRTFDFDRLKQEEVKEFSCKIKEIIALKNNDVIKYGDLRFLSDENKFIVERRYNGQTIRLEVDTVSSAVDKTDVLGYNIYSD